MPSRAQSKIVKTVINLLEETSQYVFTLKTDLINSTGDKPYSIITLHYFPY